MKPLKSCFHHSDEILHFATFYLRSCRGVVDELPARLVNQWAAVFNDFSNLCDETCLNMASRIQ